jgi:hypothetical protein
VRSRGETSDGIEHLTRHPEVIESDRSTATVEEAEHDALPVHRWNAGDAEIELA